MGGFPFLCGNLPGGSPVRSNAVIHAVYTAIVYKNESEGLVEISWNSLLEKVKEIFLGDQINPLLCIGQKH